MMAGVTDGHHKNLARRMNEAIGTRSLRDVARLTGHSAETVRRYLATGRVTTEFAVRLALATGVRLEWLLSDNGAMTERAHRLSILAESSVHDLVAVLGEALATDRHKIELLEAKVAALERSITAK
jgi:hypothetical protein